MIFSDSNDWKYESFIQYEYIYISIEDKIFRINPSRVKCRMIDVSEFKSKQQFIEELKKSVNVPIIHYDKLDRLNGSTAIHLNRLEIITEIINKIKKIWGNKFSGCKFFFKVVLNWDVKNMLMSLKGRINRPFNK